MIFETFESALSQLFDGTISKEDFVELEEYLGSSPDALSCYVEYVDLHNVLDLKLVRSSRLSAVVPEAIPMDRILVRQRKRSMQSALFAAAAAFVVLALTLKLIWLKNPEPLLSFRTAPDSSIVVTHDSAAVEVPDDGTLAIGSRLQLIHGTVELTLATGVTSIVRAPADFTLSAENKLYLNHGTAWFHVEKSGHGFQVRTPNVLVTDLGTEFGVISEQNKLDEVHLFKGKVEVLNLNGLKISELLKGSMARIAGPAGRLNEIAPSEDPFLKRLPDTNSLPPHLHWSFDGENPFKVAGTLPGADSIDTRPVQSDGRPAVERIVSGKKGKALLFDGKGDQLETDWEGFLGRAPRTLACWIRVHPDDDSGWGSIAEWGGDGNGAYWRARVVKNELGPGAVMRVGYFGGWVDGHTNIADGEWHHLAFVEGDFTDASGYPSLSFYVDGQEEQLTYFQSKLPDIVFNTEAGRLAVIGLGLGAGRSGGKLHGLLDELFLFEGTLSPDEIHRLMSTHYP